MHSFLCMAGTDIIGDNRQKIIHGRRKTEKNFRLGWDKYKRPAGSTNNLLVERSNRKD